MPVSLTFLYPHAGWLLLLLPFLWWLAPTRRVGHAVLRALTLLCVVVACAQPSLIYRSGVAPQVYVVDQRDDLSPQARATIRAALARRLAAAPRGHRLLVQLGGAPIAAPVDARQMLPGGSLAPGLAAAVQALPLGTGGITLVTDGRSTDRHWEREVTAMIRRGIPVDTIRIEDPAARAFIGAIDAAPVRIGETATVTVAVQGDGRDHVLSLTSGGRTLANAVVRGAGESEVALRFPVNRAGFVPLRATLADATGAGRTIDAFLAVQDPLPLLYLGSRQVGAAPLLQRLLGRGFRVETRDPATLGAGFDFAHYPLVMLDDVPAAQLSAATQRALVDAVTDADVGLLASGGDTMFGGGSYYATGPLGQALPVLPQPEEKVEQPSVGVVIVIDTSGSMHGPRSDYAKQIARRIAGKLKPTDQIGVLEFYGARQWTVPLQPATDPDAVNRAISRLQGTGGSDNLLPALEDAYYALKGVNTRYKNIVVISDGELQPDRYDQLLGRIAQDRINVSTVQTGNDAEGTEAMARWARIGHGRFYQVNDEFSLVSIDFRQPQIKPQPGYRPGTYPLRDMASPLWWRDAGVSAIPPLGGYARVRVRPQAEALLATAAGDPVLASWHVGGGRVTALTTEPLGAGSRGWQGWRQYGQWLSRIAGLTARRRPDLSVDLARRFDRLALSAQRLDGRPWPAPAMRFVDADGRTIGTPAGVEERAPGLFVGDTPFAEARSALVEARDGDGDVVRAANRAHADIAAAGAVLPSRALPLARLSALTGGRFDDGPQGVGAAPPARAGGRAAADLWPWLMLAALLLYLSDLFYRRSPRRRPVMI